MYTFRYVIRFIGFVLFLWIAWYICKNYMPTIIDRAQSMARLAWRELTHCAKETLDFLMKLKDTSLPDVAR